MIEISRITLLAGAVALAACQQQATTDATPAPNPTDVPTAAAPSPQDTVTPVPGTLPSPTGTNPSESKPLAGENDGYPDLTPAPVTAEAAKTEKGARAILLAWARGIELREFDQSWAMMGDAAKSRLSKTAFNAKFHPLHDLVVSVPGGTMEGAAGSSYYTVPVTVTGTEADGTQVKLKGDIIMRRVNDVPGATPDQLRWHIERADLKYRAVHSIR